MEELTIEGRVIALTEGRTYTSRTTGTVYDVRGFVVETEEQYPKKCHVEVTSNDSRPRWQTWDLKVGDRVKVWLSIAARENGGRWFNTVSGYKLEKKA